MQLECFIPAVALEALDPLALVVKLIQDDLDNVERQVRWPTAAITPLETGRAMMGDKVRDIRVRLISLAPEDDALLNWVEQGQVAKDFLAVRIALAMLAPAHWPHLGPNADMIRQESATTVTMRGRQTEK